MVLRGQSTKMTVVVRVLGSHDSLSSMFRDGPIIRSSEMTQEIFLYGLLFLLLLLLLLLFLCFSSVSLFSSSSFSSFYSYFSFNIFALVFSFLVLLFLNRRHLTARNT